MKSFSFKILIHLFILRPFIKFLFGINVYDRNNILRSDRFIIIANHNSHLDILLLFYLLPLKQISITHPVAAKEYFSKYKIVFNVVKYLFDPVWVTRRESDSGFDFIKQVKAKLDIGHNIIIFPEGTRGSSGEVQTFKGGVGVIAEQYPDIPVIPVYLSGTERSFPKRSYIPMPVWHNVIVGEPQMFLGSSGEVKHSLETFIKDLSKNELLGRHQRKIKRKSAIRSIAILGIDGSGKSTLSRNTAKRLSFRSNAFLVSDRLEYYSDSQKNPVQPFFIEIIRRRIGSYAKKAKSLKFYKIPKLTELILRDKLIARIKKWYSSDVAVLDGCPLLNLTAWSILYKEEGFNEVACLKGLKVLTSTDEEISNDDKIYKDFSELKLLKKLRLNHFNLPDMIIFLDVEPEIAIERIKKRGEKEQVHETPEKLGKLRNAYLSACTVIQNNLNIPTLILAGNDSIQNITDSATEFIAKHMKPKSYNE